MRAHLKIIAAAAATGALVAAAAFGQAGRKPGAPDDVGKERGAFLNVVATRADGSDERITAKQLALYDGGMDQVIQRLTEGTGGRVLSVNDSREAAKEICDELRKNRYVLAYTPTSLPLYEARRLLIVPEEGISVRYKLTQPGN